VITGQFHPTVPAPLVSAVVTLLNVPNVSQLPRPVPFLIDTGTQRTCVHPLDGARLGLSADLMAPGGTWAPTEPMEGIGGATPYYVVDADLAFWHQNDQRWQHLQVSVRVAPLVPHTEQLASLLGMDILQHFRLVVDWASRTVELH
jgi:hypothetical protein